MMAVGIPTDGGAWKTRLLLLLLLQSVSAESPIRGPPSVLGEEYSQKKRVVEGEDVKLTCPVEGNPEPIVEWSKGNEMSRIESFGRFRVAKNWLRIKTATPVDQGMYTCQAINGFGSVQFTFFVTVVGGIGSILEVSSGNLRMKHVTPPSGSALRKAVGHSVQFECRVEGNPRPEITWLKDGAVIKPHLRLSPLPQSDTRPKENSGHGIADDTLKLEQLELRDTGKYSCFASNLLGIASANWTLTVIGQSSYEHQSKALQMSNVTTFVGEDAVLICKGPRGSDDLPKIMWLRGLNESKMKRISPNRTFLFKGQRYEVLKPSEVVFLDDNTFITKLVIADVHITDQGLYVCTASGRLGVEVRRGHLTVIETEVVHRRGSTFVLVWSGLAICVVIVIVVGVAVSFCSKKKDRKHRPSINERMPLSTASSDKFPPSGAPYHEASIHSARKQTTAPHPTQPVTVSHLSSTQISQKGHPQDASRFDLSPTALGCLNVPERGHQCFISSQSTSSGQCHLQHPYHRMNLI